MKTAILIMLIAVSAVAAQDLKEPARLKKNREIYLAALAKIEAERDAKVKVLTKKYLKVLQETQTYYTVRNDLDSAVAVKKAIADLKPILRTPQVPENGPEPVKPKGLPKVRRIVIYNVNFPKVGHNGYTEGGSVEIYAGEKSVHIQDFKLKHTAGKKTKATIELKVPMEVTKVRIDCSNGQTGTQVGLVEVQVIDWRGKNVAASADIRSSAPLKTGAGNLMSAKNLVDGDLEPYNRDGGWWQTGGLKGWVELTWK